MKKLTLAFVVALLCQCFAAKAQTPVEPFEVQMRVYKAALKNYDLQAATMAVYNMEALKPERTDLQDSLALIYFAGERFAQAYLIGEEILKTQPNRKDILEVVAVSKQNLGMVKEALADYEKLYGIDKSIYYLYQMATMQYQLKRFGECVASLDQILGSPDSEKQKVNIRMQGGSQDVIMKAAAYNVKGICALEMNQKEIARDNFTKALQVEPDFALAKGNLGAMDKPADAKPIGGANPKPSTTPAKTPGH